MRLSTKIRLIVIMLFPMILLIAASGQKEIGLEVTKYSPGGSVEWKNLYEDAKGETVLVDHNDDIIISGLYKLDGEGNVVWQHDIAHYNLVLDSENNLYLDNFNFDLVKIDENGSVQWSYAYEDIFVYYLAVDRSETAFIFAEKDNLDTYEIEKELLIRYEDDGTLLWYLSFSPEEVFPYYGNSLIKQDENNYLYLITLVREYDEYTATAIYKLHQNGSIVWQRELDFICSASEVTEEGIIILINYKEMMALDVKGEELWKKEIMQGPLLYVEKMMLDSMGNIVVLYSESWRDGNENEVMVVKYSPDGEELWSASLNRASDNMYNLRIDADDNIIIGGTSCTWHDCQCMTVKYTADGAKKWTKFNRTGYDEQSCGLDVDSEGHVIVGALLGVKNEKEDDDDESGCGCF